MNHLNDQLVRARHSIRQAEVIQEQAYAGLAHPSITNSTRQPARTADRLGDSLIRLGQKLKEGGRSTTSSSDLIYDCD